MTQVDGHQIKQAIQRWQLRRDTAATQFKETQYHFKGEDKSTPDEAMETFLLAEESVARLQALQSTYNLSVKVDFKGSSRPITLCEAVKRLGGAGRAEKMWREYAVCTGRSSYDREPTKSRRMDEEHAERAVGVRECVVRASKAATYAGNLRAAVARANSTTLDIAPPDEALFND